MNFCNRCKNILVKKKNENQYMNYCVLCDEFYPLTNKILFQKSNLTHDKKLQLQVEVAIYDNTYPKIEQKCPNCPATVIKYFVDRDSLKYIYVCTTCRHYWM